MIDLSHEFIYLVLVLIGFTASWTIEYMWIISIAHCADILIYNYLIL